MSKNILFFTALIFIILYSVFIYIQNSKPVGYKPGKSNEQDIAVNQAKYFYKQSKDRGEDFGNGKCLTNALMPGWVVDIVHSPRQPIDDLPENQCKSYVPGGATHFVELDMQGNVVRVE